MILPWSSLTSVLFTHNSVTVLANFQIIPMDVVEPFHATKCLLRINYSPVEDVSRLSSLPSVQ